LTNEVIGPRAHVKDTIGQTGAFMVTKLWDATRLRLFSRGSRRVVRLDRLLIGHQGGVPLERWVRLTGDWSRVSCALADSPYVRFLQEADEEKLRDDGWLMSTAYFRMAETCIAATGHFKGAIDAVGILVRMREFHAALTSAGTMPDVRVRRGTPIRVWRIEHADCFEIIDGHHRLASDWVRGEHTSEATVYSAKLTYLQKLLLDVNQASGRELYQPVPALDVESWRVVRGCEDRLAMMTSFLDGEGRTSGTLLDLACSYGWFVKRFKDAGFTARGIDRDPDALHVGTCVFALSGDELQSARIETFLSDTHEQYDVVLFLSILHHYALGQERAPLEFILGRLDSITRGVLFIDTGEGHEAWYRETLTEWTPEHIRTVIMQHTSFSSVVALGTDRDNRAPYADNYGRTLFACTR
jgi:2-polyprenyl-3-methyl-5-hydroxy-6-metoxy-1,4-benzoquinol methylase